MKEWHNKYNSFNSMKALVHVPYWKKAYDTNTIAPPLFVSVDPSAICQLNCKHCNAAEALQTKQGMMSKETVDQLIQVFKNQWFTASICIGGGGEPLTNDNTYYLIDQLKENNIQIAFVTNGVKLNKNIETILKCDYLGISVDCATSKTFSVVKGVNEDIFNTVIRNISNITSKGLEICYKYLLLPTNYNEIYDAIKLAKNIGCDLFHMRPGSDPWFDRNMIRFNENIIKIVEEQINRARSDFEDDNFKIFSVVNKFSENWSPKLTFNKCYTCLTTCYISFDGTIGLCCDRRGDNSIELGNISESNIWGSEKHKNIHNSIDVKQCPRCTFSSVNEIYENVIIKDRMFYNFF
ncbi:MAG: radical SAM protein [Candidatus Omnitrophica bacterium]|jgi:MoaA/NifB/PqqE/SkfB family radical SAM enzyme|nr:radical SAM protein [Candidatus Omnitrophota bacterium]